MKHCPRCERDLPEATFGRDRSTKDGLCWCCRLCMRDYRRKQKEAGGGRRGPNLFLGQPRTPEASSGTSASFVPDDFASDVDFAAGIVVENIGTTGFPRERRA